AAAEILGQLTGGDLARDPEQLAQRALNLKTSMTDETWTQFRDAVAAGLATGAQRLIAEYGVGDLLPDDPARPGKGDRSFSLAARALQSARGLLPDDPVYAGYRQDLETRRLLCSGLDQIYQDKAVSGRGDLQL